MRETEAPRMQRVARKPLERVAVHGVSDDRPSARSKMHANLMAPAGDGPAPEQRPPLGPYIYICEPFVYICEPFVDGRARRAVRPDDSPAAVHRIRPERQ